MQEKKMAIRYSATADKRRNQPQDPGQLKGLRGNLPQAEDCLQKWDCQ
jgi:hypothetical protein